MLRVSHQQPAVTVGVDTHGDVHVGAVVDELGMILGTIQVDADPRGYRTLEWFARSFGPIAQIGVEGTGAYGAGLSRWLRERGHTVIEVNRPDRRTRRFLGKSDTIDACAAARQVLSGVATALPKARDGDVEMIRALRVARRSSVRARTAAMNQIHSLVQSAPESVRGPLRPLSPAQLVEKASRFRIPTIATPADATRFSLRELARRHASLNAEVRRLDAELGRLVRRAAPELLQLRGVGPEVAGALLVTVGDNRERLVSEASFAHLCGVAPIPASSGKTTGTD